MHDINPDEPLLIWLPDIMLRMVEPQIIEEWENKVDKKARAKLDKEEKARERALTKAAKEQAKAAKEQAKADGVKAKQPKATKAKSKVEFISIGISARIRVRIHDHR